MSFRDKAMKISALTLTSAASLALGAAISFFLLG